MAIFRGEELIFRRERCCETAAAGFDAGALGPGQLLVEARYTLVSQGTELANFTGLDPGTRQPVEQVRVHRAERAGDPDLVIEATGSDAGLRLALDLVRDGGEVILLGTPRGRSSSDPVHLMSAIHYRGLRVTGALEWLLPLHGAPWSAGW